MKRSLILSVAILAVILLLGGYVEHATQSAARRYQQALYDVGSSLENADWPQARDQLAALSARWERECEGIQLWVNHADTDAVTHALNGLIASVDLRDILSSRLYLGECLENFNHLHHRDAFTLKNIL